MSHLEEKQLSREEIYTGSVLHVVRDTIELPNGATSHREICLHIGAVAVIPLLDDGRVIMERQYRYAHGRVFFEIPAGKLDTPDEDPAEAALRELREETGALCETLTHIGDIVPSPAILTERISMYLAEGLSFTDTEYDEGEFIEIVRIPLPELVEMIMRGEIEDAKTQTAILKVWNLKNK